MEAKKEFDNVQGINGGLTSTGTLRLTNFHLVFCAPPPQQKNAKNSNDSATAGAPVKKRESWISYPMLSYCAFRPTPPSSGFPSSIRIRCRDFTFVTFSFKNEQIAREAFEFIRTRTCKLGTIENLYAFHHVPLKVEKPINGWSLYDTRAEFRRQGISEKLPDIGWRISTINMDYSFCDTYPALLVVPSSISDNTLKYARDFRSRNRIPVLSYLHPVNHCTILRSSQPFAGLTRKTNIQDERLVCTAFSSHIPRTSSSDSDRADPPSQSSGEDVDVVSELSDYERMEDSLINAPIMYDEKTGKRLIYGAQQTNLIVDARPTINAIVNQMQGYGSENMDKYKNSRKIFLSIENIHIMRSSLNKVIDAIKDADISSLPPDGELLMRSGWLKHIQAILDGSAIIVRQVGINHSHVLIHCSDGWDRTSQLSALAQLMLDPYYRTLEGFMVLVEKDWLSFGHNFRLRSGFLNHDDWFTIQKDALAGTPIQPGESEGRGDALQSALENAARRIFGQGKQELDQDPNNTESAPPQAIANEKTIPRMVSPVFHQFLDCVYQLLRQNPSRFEFNERFLRRLFYHLYSCQYGTFLYNSEMQRHDARAAERTSSVWDYFLARKQEFTNPDYDALVDDHVKGRERIILPQLNKIRWWHQIFNRTDEEMNGMLNAAELSESNRASTLAAVQTKRGVTTLPPPTLSSSQSVLSAVEMAHGTLTPGDRVPSMHRSASADSPGAFASIRDGIAGLGLGKSMMGSTSDSASQASGTSTDPLRADRELQEMT